jgi:hypothetical protein
MSRVWPIDYMDGWTSIITEQDDGNLLVVVSHESGKSWRAVKETIVDAVTLSLRIVAEQTPVTIIIDPLLDYLDFEFAWSPQEDTHRAPRQPEQALQVADDLRGLAQRDPVDQPARVAGDAGPPREAADHAGGGHDARHVDA